MVKFSSMEDGKTGAGAAGRRSSGERMSFRQLAAQRERKGGTDSLANAAGSHRAHAEDRKKLYGEASDYLSEVMAAVRNEKPFSLAPAIEILERVADIQTPLDSLFLKAIHSDESHNFVVNHSVNAAIYSMKMAETLGFSKTRQVEIGMLGLFHDVGMALISDEIVYKKERLSDREFEALKDRPNLGYKVLKVYENDYPFLAEGTLQAYEKIDGSGYPKGLVGDEIHEYAQIVGLVDVYEALIHTRPQRQRLPHFFAVKEIIRTGKRQFQRQYLKALLNTFSIFPLLSYVRLNSKAIGQVVKTYPDQPMRPKIRVIYDSQKNRVLTERLINLPENPLLYITDSISEDELLAISERSDLVPSKSRPAAVPTDENGNGNNKNYRGKRKKSRAKRRFPFFRMGWAPLSAALFLVLLGCVAAYLGLANQSLPKASAMAQSSVAPSQTQTVAETPFDGKPGQKGIFAKADLPSMTIAAGSAPGHDGVRRHNRPAGKADLKKDAGDGAGSIDAQTKSPLTALVDDKVKRADAVSTERPAEKIAAEKTGGDWEPNFPFSIKLSSHKTVIDAQKVVEKCNHAGISAYWVKADLGSDGIWYRVFTGYFQNRKQAREFMHERNLIDARIKQTRYATLIGSFPEPAEAGKSVATLVGKGFSPYTIEQAQKMHVCVGAFYTHKGAEDQYAALLASGIPSRIIKR